MKKITTLEIYLVQGGSKNTQDLSAGWSREDCQAFCLIGLYIDEFFSKLDYYLLSPKDPEGTDLALRIGAGLM
jgi:hypothetical protein